MSQVPRILWIFALLAACASINAQSPENFRLSLNSPAISIEISPGKVFVGSGNEIQILTHQLKRVARIQTELDSINDIAVNKTYLFAAGGSPAEHGMIEKYALDTMKLVSRKIVHKDVINQIELDTSYLVSASADSTVKKIDIETLRPILTYSNHSKRVTSVALLNELHVVSGGLDDTLRFWDISTGNTMRTLTHHQNDVLGVEAKLTDRSSLPMIATVSRDQTIRFWQPTIGRMVRFKKLDVIPTTCKWINNSQLVLVGTDNGQILKIDSLSLEIKKIANVSQRIYELKIIDGENVLVGTSRGIFRLRF